MRTRSKAILAVLLAVVLITAAGYAAAPQLAAAIAMRSLAGRVDIRELRIDSIGLSRTEVAALRIEEPGLNVELRRATLRYDLWPLRIRGIKVGRARVALDSRAGGDGDTALALPPFPVTVDELSLRAATPWGDVALADTSARLSPGPAGGWQAALEGNDLALQLSNPGRGRHTLTLSAGGAPPLVSLDARGGQLPIEFDARLEPRRLLAWLQDQAPLPAGLRAPLAPYALAKGTLQVQGVLREAFELEATLRGDITLRDTRDAKLRLFRALNVASSGGYTVTRAGDSWSGAGDADFSLALDAESVVSGSEPEWHWNRDGLSFSAAAAALEPLALRAERINAQMVPEDGSGARGQLAVTGLRLSPWPEALAGYDLSGTWRWGQAAIEAGGQGRGVGLPALDWTVVSRDQAGRIDITVHDDIAALQSSLAPYAARIAPDFALRDGTLDGRYEYRWSADGARTNLALTAGSVAMDLGGMSVEGLKMRVTNADEQLDQLAISAAAPKLTLAAGSVAHELRIALHIAPPQVRVDTAAAHLFGGELSLRPTSFRLDDQEIELYLDIGGLSLEQVMALMELESTQLTGRVSGPVHMIYRPGEGLEINQGKLHSEGSGVLRFSLKGQSAPASQLNNMALRALEDFQYDELNASLLYKPNGEYRISARIVGSNPEVLDGHPFAFNPTIEGRLPALFRAFLITGDFSRAIIDQLQQQGPSTSGQTSTLNKD